MRHGFSTKPLRQKDNQWNGVIQILRGKKIQRHFFDLKNHGLGVLGPKGPLLVEFLPRGQTITAATCCKTLEKLRRAIQNKQRGMLTKRVCLLHDNATPHTDLATKRLLDTFGWDILCHPPHSPDLALSDHHLFPKLKEDLGGKTFDDDGEVEEYVNTWLHDLAANFYDDGIKKLIGRYTKCLEINGDYVEK